MDIIQFIELYVNASDEVRIQIEGIVSIFEEQSAYPAEASVSARINP